MDNNEEKIAEIVREEVSKTIKKEMPRYTPGKIYGFVKDIVTLALIALIVVFGFKVYDGLKRNTSIIDVEGHDLTLDNNGIFGYKVADFEEAILGTATKKALLIVDEQELSVVSTITQTGLFNLGIFSKNQSVTYYGIGQYTVDLSKLDASNIVVDKDNYVVTVTVPSVELHDVVLDINKTKYSDTEKGLLAFGDIQMTQEENNKVTAEAIAKLTERGLQTDCVKKANEFAKYVIRDLFEASIKDVSKIYKVNVVFEG